MFFFFKQKTAYEMRISDWSSDVCSSDLEAGEHSRGVERAQGAQVDDLGLDSLARQRVGGFERERDADRIADDGDVAPFAHDPGLADRQHEILGIGHVEAAAIEQLVFQEEDRKSTRLNSSH